MFELKFTQAADLKLKELEANPAKSGRVKQIKKSLGYLQTNPRHPSLNTHPYDSIEHPWNPTEKVFEAYAQNRTPSAYRIFWCYGPGGKQITIVALSPHP